MKFEGDGYQSRVHAGQHRLCVPKFIGVLTLDLLSRDTGACVSGYACAHMHMHATMLIDSHDTIAHAMNAHAVCLGT